MNNENTNGCRTFGSAGDDELAGPNWVLRAAVNERVGSDGKPYAIGFEMRLPDRWNGGNDGAVVPAYGASPSNQSDNALARGYAAAWRISRAFIRFPAWPTVARYQGSGDIESAGSFRCE